MKFDKDLLIKIAGVGLTLAGTVVAGISTKKENSKELAKLVEEKLKEQ